MFKKVYSLENTCDGVLLSTVAGMRALQALQKYNTSQMLSCETCEVLKKISFKENCWSTASDFQEHFGQIACFISKKLTNCLELPETAVYKRLTVFALEIFKDNQIIVKVETNILLVRSMQQRK